MVPFASGRALMQCLIISKVAFEFSQSRDKCSGRPTAGRKYRHCLLQCVKGTGYYEENDLTVKISKKPVPMQRLRILLMKRACSPIGFSHLGPARPGSRPRLPPMLLLAASHTPCTVVPNIRACRSNCKAHPVIHVETKAYRIAGHER